ncbi:DUF4410 domain-containing protein [Methylococcus sp. EFPC2]|uniref:DUF4410 domain-containing protein n=1 Tax=Methylococcus sp. EFPC2 TaxID=2812648 RepID=UPI001967B23B|nr:DUF4410 domain-containing protein [Methylococcus sp. EFPC2]QSA98867.1 hypothetical protein JWZ97_08875 [Methylococcus sp. EFPC2]
MTIRSFLHLPILASLLLLTACATNIKPTAESNPAPTAKFSDFSRYELAPVQAGSAEVAAQTAAVAKIQEHLDEKLGARLKQWNAQPAKSPARTLRIEPTVTELKFVGGAKRFFAGAMAGSSAVILKARITEKETGKLVASPEFYSKSSAMAGAVTIGGNDNAMLGRIANALAVYVINNYKQAVGGPVLPPTEEASAVSAE